MFRKNKNQVPVEIIRVNVSDSNEYSKNKKKIDSIYGPWGPSSPFLQVQEMRKQHEHQLKYINKQNKKEDEWRFIPKDKNMMVKFLEEKGYGDFITTLDNGKKVINKDELIFYLVKEVE